MAKRNKAAAPQNSGATQGQPDKPEETRQPPTPQGLAAEKREAARAADLPPLDTGQDPGPGESLPHSEGLPHGVGASVASSEPPTPEDREPAAPIEVQQAQQERAGDLEPPAQRSITRTGARVVKSRARRKAEVQRKPAAGARRKSRK